MAVLDSTQFNQLVQEVREALLAGSQGVGEVEIVSSLSNIVSLPALRLVGATESVVEAPLELLSAPAVEAAADARKATDDAVVAGVNAEAAADLSEAERKDLAEIKEQAIKAGTDAASKGAKAFAGAMNAENATLYAMQVASYLQTKLEQAQIVILSGKAMQDVIGTLDSQVKDSILICASTRDAAYAAILQLSELQKQVAQAIVDAYAVFDQMQLSVADARQATRVTVKAMERICELSERTEQVIIESVIQTGEARLATLRLESLEKYLLLSKSEADIAAARALDAANTAENIVSGIRPDYNEPDKTNSNYIANKPEIPTLDTAPAAETLAYVNRDGNEVAFKIGDEVRYYNAEEGEFIFFKLYDIRNGKAVWVSSLDGNFAETPTLPAKPTETTLTYKSGEATRNFAIGQQCRVYDTENKKYVFYQLYDITAENKADWQIAGSDGSAFLETVKITLSSNQGVGDAALNGVVVTIKYSGSQTDLVWNGTELSATIPMSVEYQVICGNASGYLSPETQTYLAIGGNKRQISLAYSTEKVTINVSTDDGADCSARTVQVINTANSEIVGSGSGSLVAIKVPFGISYKVKVDDFPGYLTPQEQIYTANSATRSVSFQYEKIADASIVFDWSINDSLNITGDVNSGVIATILSKFCCCLCKKTADGEVSISYLKGTSRNYYADNTPSKLDGTEGDIMVNFPEFYYKWEKVDDNKYRYRFAEYNVDGTFKHVPRSLVGAYKAYQTGNKLYSRSGVTPTTNASYTDLANYAAARGEGYQLIDFQQHCVIAFMLYAKYGNRNLQAVLGTGGATYSPATTTGTTNQKGNQDTVNETSGYVNGLGIEGVFGGLYEWTQGVSIQNRVWTITDPDGTQRNVNAGTENGWITKIAAETGPFFDMVPVAVGGSETTHYSDYYYQKSGGPFCLLRSYRSSSTIGGVAFSDAYDAASVSSAGIGSRLAFRGVVRESQSVSAFKSLPVL